MPYPIVSKSDARSYLIALGDNQHTYLPDVRFSDNGPEEDWPTIGAEVAAELLKLLALHTAADGTLESAHFEAAGAPAIHELLPEHPALANPEFWTWLALFHGQEIVAGRYAKAEKINLKNFGIGGSAENLLYRLWLRADIAYDDAQADHYELARVGDIDFWRSHVFRQGYGDARIFALALVDFQFPQSADRAPRLRISQIRELAKQLKRARSNLLFEVMTKARASRFIESEWDRLASL